MKKYDPHKIEKEWQKYWEEQKTFEVVENVQKQKFYALFEFPYPSGDGLHVGHQRPYTAMDIIARKKRMEGYNVLFPMGFDAFGLPAENYAIKTGKPPAEVTQKNIANFTRQLKNIGYSFDWSRAVDTTDPKYYKWTQWIFLQLFKHGLAYKKNQPINWCPKDKIGLANEEVVGGSCERCGTLVEKRNKEQWMLAITKYADKLLEGLSEVDYIPQAKTQQENWIGRSEGAEIDFILNFKKNPKDNERRDSEGKPAHLTVFTTRPDTIFGATYLVMAPEHLWVTLATDEQHNVLENKLEVIEYLQQVKNKTEIERTSEQKEKTGVELKGVKALHPITQEELPIFVADYVLGNYGTGVIMAVPAHDERDFEFAQQFRLPIKPVIAKYFVETANPPRKEKNTVRRKTVHAIVRRKTDGAVLMLKWKSNQRPDGAYPYTFIIGGVEEGEDVVESSLRELKEETGIANAKFVQEVPITVHTEYFAGHKDQNRYSEITVLHFEVSGKGQVDVSEEELQKHEPVWVPENEVLQTINIVDGPYIWQQFLHTTAMTDGGIVCNSDFLNDLSVDDAKQKIIQWLEEHKSGNRKVQYKLRDWVFSRQRYWGEPIPLVYCEACKERVNHLQPQTKNHQWDQGEILNPGWIPLPEDQLPLELPKVEKYEPTDTGESPLSKIEEWVNTTCPKCGGPARRETDTMPNWAGSSWYFLRYCDPHNDKEFAAQDKLKYWTPVDWYNGGMEHTVLHLLYSRFWNQFLFDIGLVPTREPYKKRTSHGMILAKGGEKMSKSRGNVVNPDDMVEEYGADALRMYIMFMGPFDQAVEWDTNGLVGVKRFLDRVWNLQEKISTTENKDTKQLTSLVHQTIKKITENIEGMRFNTAIAAMMELVNEMNKQESISKSSYSLLLRLLYPFAPHITEELWTEILKNKSE
jgi:leucyl-tRNA synthetase